LFRVEGPNPWSGKVITARLPFVGSFGEPDVRHTNEEAVK